MEEMETEEDIKSGPDKGTTVLDTNTACFLCLSNQISNGDVIKPIKEDFSQEKRVSLLSICRYLEIDGANFPVTLCKKCSDVTLKLSDLCHKLEQIQMKVDHCLQSFLSQLEDSVTESLPVQNNHKSQAEQLYQVFVENLRKKIKTQCEAKLNPKLPKALLREQKKMPQQNMTTPPNTTAFVPKIISTQSLLQPQSPPISLQEPPATPKEIPTSLLKPAVIPTNSIYKCEFCYKIFSQKYLQTAHMKSKHLPPSPPVSGPTIKTTPINKSPKFKTPPKSGKGKLHLCTLCDPPFQVLAVTTKEHTIRIHVETLMTEYKLPQTSPEDFKIYCDHIFKIETISSRKETDSEGKITCHCSYCIGIFSRHDKLRFHLYNCHQDLMGQKLIDIQKCKTVNQIKSIKLPPFTSMKKKKEKPKKHNYTCKICDPNCTFIVNHLLIKHQILHHFDYLMSKHKMENISSEDFKLYGKQVLKVEPITAKSGTNAEEKIIYNCPFCSQTYEASSECLKYHLYFKHKKILTNKLVELQKDTSVEELKAVKLPKSTSLVDVKCIKCGTTCKGKCNLSLHKKYQCEFGPKSTPSDDFGCSNCERKFKFETHLKIHQTKCERETQNKSKSKTGSKKGPRKEDDLKSSYVSGIVKFEDGIEEEMDEKYEDLDLEPQEQMDVEIDGFNVKTEHFNENVDVIVADDDPLQL